MLRRTLRPVLAALMATTLAATSTVAGQLPAQAEPDAGPPYEYTKEIIDPDFVVVPLYRAARILRSQHGYIYESGLQDGHLTVRRVERGLRFADTRTREWRGLPRACRKVRARVGIAAICRVPLGISVSQPLLVEVWPRLGDDFTSGATLPATIVMSVLGDAGNDVARLGAGADFFNGAFGHDRAFGGAGNDWIRTGTERDRIWGGPGHDYLIGVAGPDIIYGGDGNDRVGGADGDDWLQGDAGADYVTCGTGTDTVLRDAPDTLRNCEIFREG